MSTTLPAESRTVVENVQWETYVALADDRLGNMPQMTFSQGRLELMSPKKEHETAKTLLGMMIRAYCEYRDIDILSVASTTFHRHDLNRGFEADEAYYFEHAVSIRGKEEIDLQVDPPPELVVEIEITSSAIAKLDLFAAMFVPEVWRYDGQSLRLFRLPQLLYRRMTECVALPGFPVAVAESLLNQRFDRGEIALIRQFRRSFA